MRIHSHVWVTVMLCSAALIGGVAYAFWPTIQPLFQPGAGVPPSLSGTHLISQPIVNPRLNAADLLADISAQGGIPVGVTRCVTSSDTFQVYNGVSGTAFPLVQPEAYFVQMAASAPGYTITGADINPSTFTLAGPGSGSASGTHCLSVPCDDAASLGNAAALFGFIPNATTVCRFVRNTDNFQCYFGTSGINFPLTTGEGYLVQVSANSTFTFP